MTTDRAGAGIPTDDQLADILRFVARICLEVERGMRPPAHLRPLMHPAERWLQRGQLGHFRGGPVHSGHIGQPQISRLTDAHIFGTVITRTEGDRWGALSIELRGAHGRWRIAGLQRLLARAEYRTPPSARVELDGRTGHVRADLAEVREMAAAAHTATARRLAELTPGTPGHRAAGELAHHWKRKLGELDRQLADVAARQHARENVERVLRR